VTDPIAEFKAKQRETWALGDFCEAAVHTASVAGHLARFADLRAGQTVLDVGTGTGVVALAAARLGASAAGLDLSPVLLEQAKQSALSAGVSVAWKEGDAEGLPYGEASFDVVLSQFGHIFAPRPDVALKEMLRVLKPGGRIAFAAWPPEQLVGRSVALSAKYLPPPVEFPSPMLWGDVDVVRERLGPGVRDLSFERGVMGIPARSPLHFLDWQTSRIGPLIKTIGALRKDLSKLEAWTKESIDLIASYMVDNVVQHEYLLTRATKV